MNVFYKFDYGFYPHTSRPYVIEWIDSDTYRQYRFVIWQDLTVIKYRTDCFPISIINQIDLLGTLKHK